MGYLSKSDFESQMRRIRSNAESNERKQLLKQEKQKYKHKRKWPSTSKLILVGAVLLCLEIVIFCEYTMITLGDTSSMYVLIGIPATLIPIIWGYYSKAKAENTAGGITFETIMKELNEQHMNRYPNNDTEAKG